MILFFYLILKFYKSNTIFYNLKKLKLLRNILKFQNDFNNLFVNIRIKIVLNFLKNRKNKKYKGGFGKLPFYLILI